MIKLVLPKFWRRREVVSYGLVPFSFLYRIFIGLYRFYYAKLSCSKFPISIIVVGNITVGGTGKTPLVIFLVDLLRSRGYKPGVISRGYGRSSSSSSITVNEICKVEEVGDEALLIFKQTQCPVVVDNNRIAAAKKLYDDYKCNIIISDDGLQHYKLPRDIEIILVDAEFGVGNGFCLPAGPLREPISRLKTVDLVVKNFNTSVVPSGVNGVYSMVLEPIGFYNIKNPTMIKSVADFQGQSIHAVAGIGIPDKFFRTLRQLGLSITPHPFPDHYRYHISDFIFAQSDIIVMTEKDAVKCCQIATDNFWYLKVGAKLEHRFIEALLNKLKK